MKVQHLLILSILTISINSFSQNCENIKMNIDSDYSYINQKEGIEMPFNSSWNVVFEYQKAIVVFMKNNNETANFGILANTNGSPIKSAHSLDLNIINQLLKKIAPSVGNVELADVYIKNLPAKEVKYDYTLVNIDESSKMSGLMYMIVKHSKTYVFMLSSSENDSDCYLKFLRDVLKNTKFDTTWYENYAR